MKPIFHDLANPVTAAVLPLKEQAQDRAEQEARQMIKTALNLLEENGWDARAVAPYPDSLRVGREQYRRMKAKHDFVLRITTTDHSKYYGSFRGPHYVLRCPEHEERFVKLARDEAAAQYDMFVIKLVGKVGPVTEAKLEGSHVWGHSFLTVRNADGTQDIWKTQQIVNRSGLGTMFNQWPTRKLKR